MKKQNNKWLVILLTIAVTLSAVNCASNKKQSQDQTQDQAKDRTPYYDVIGVIRNNPENISWIRAGNLYTYSDGKIVRDNLEVTVISIDNNLTNLGVGSITALRAGEHTIEIYPTSYPEAESIKQTLLFEPGLYYELQLHFYFPKLFTSAWDKVKKEMVIKDETYRVQHGIGDYYNAFMKAEQKHGITKLWDSIGQMRAPMEKSNYNFGVYDLLVAPSDLVTIRIKSIKGTLFISDFNGEEVPWYGDSIGSVVRIPSGQNSMKLTYIAERSDFSHRSILGLIVMGATALHNLSLNKKDIADISLTYDFSPGAEYELISVKSGKKDKSYSEVEVIPIKNFPKGQVHGRGAVSKNAAISATTNSAPATTQTSAQSTQPVIAYSVAISGKPAGPYTYEELKQLALKGDLTRDTLVWKEGMPQWIAAGTVDELSGIWASVPPPLPPK